jgi:hypothetical protein
MSIRVLRRLQRATHCGCLVAVPRKNPVERKYIRRGVLDLVVQIVKGTLDCRGHEARNQCGHRGD